MTVEDGINVTFNREELEISGTESDTRRCTHKEPTTSPLLAFIPYRNNRLLRVNMDTAAADACFTVHRMSSSLVGQKKNNVKNCSQNQKHKKHNGAIDSNDSINNGTINHPKCHNDSEMLNEMGTMAPFHSFLCVTYGHKQSATTKTLLNQQIIHKRSNRHTTAAAFDDFKVQQFQEENFHPTWGRHEILKSLSTCCLNFQQNLQRQTQTPKTCKKRSIDALFDNMNSPTNHSEFDFRNQETLRHQLRCKDVDTKNEKWNLPTPHEVRKNIKTIDNQICRCTDCSTVREWSTKYLPRNMIHCLWFYPNDYDDMDDIANGILLHQKRGIIYNVTDSSNSSCPRKVASADANADNGQASLDISNPFCDYYQSNGVNKTQKCLNRQRKESLLQKFDEQNMPRSAKSMMTSHAEKKSSSATSYQSLNNGRDSLSSKERKNPIVALWLQKSKYANRYVCKQKWKSNEVLQLSTGKMIACVNQNNFDNCHKNASSTTYSHVYSDSEHNMKCNQMTTGKRESDVDLDTDHPVHLAVARSCISANKNINNWIGPFIFQVGDIIQFYSPLMASSNTKIQNNDIVDDKLAQTSVLEFQLCLIHQLEYVETNKIKTVTTYPTKIVETKNDIDLVTNAAVNRCMDKDCNTVTDEKQNCILDDDKKNDNTFPEDIRSQSPALSSLHSSEQSFRLLSQEEPLSQTFTLLEPDSIDKQEVQRSLIDDVTDYYKDDFDSDVVVIESNKLDIDKNHISISMKDSQTEVEEDSTNYVPLPAKSPSSQVSGHSLFVDDVEATKKKHNTMKRILPPISVLVPKTDLNASKPHTANRIIHSDDVTCSYVTQPTTEVTLEQTPFQMPKQLNKLVDSDQPSEVADRVIPIKSLSMITSKAISKELVPVENNFSKKQEVKQSSFAIYFLEKGTDMSRLLIRGNDKIEGLKSHAEKRGAIVLDSFDKLKLPLPTHIVISENLSCSDVESIAEALGFTNAIEMSDFLSKHSIVCATRRWASQGNRVERPPFQEPTVMEKYLGIWTCGTKQQRLKSTNDNNNSSGATHDKICHAEGNTTNETEYKVLIAPSVNFTTEHGAKSDIHQIAPWHQRNQGLSDLFRKLSKLHQECPLLDTDEWRAYTFQLLSGRLRHLDFEVVDDPTVLKRLKNVKGFGSSSMQIVMEYLRTGTSIRLSDFEVNKRRIAMRAFMRIWGVGRKRATELVERGYQSIRTLRNEVKNGMLTLDRNQYIGLQHYEDILEEMDRTEVEEIARIVCTAVKERYPSAEITIMGSYRRGKGKCGDADILISHPHYAETVPPRALGQIVDDLMTSGYISHHLTFISGMNVDKFESLPKAIAKHLTSPSQYGRSREKKDKYVSSSWMGIFHSPFCKGKHRRVDIKFYPYSVRTYAALYFTGNGHFNRSMRLWATRKFNYKLSDLGLFDKDTNHCVMGQIPVHEKEVFDKLNLVWKEPSERDCFDAVECITQGTDGVLQVLENDISKRDIERETTVYGWVK